MARGDPNHDQSGTPRLLLVVVVVLASWYRRLVAAAVEVGDDVPPVTPPTDLEVLLQAAERASPVRGPLEAQSVPNQRCRVPSLYRSSTRRACRLWPPRLTFTTTSTVLSAAAADARRLESH